MKHRNIKSLSFLFLLLLVLFFPPKSFSQSSNYKVINKINLHSSGFWDYLSIDPVAHRLYVSNGNKVHVINVTDDSVVGEIDSLSGVHGVAIADEFGKGFISNGQSNIVTVFDLNSLKVLASIPVTGQNPDAIVYDPFSKRVFTFNGRSSNATAIDAKTDKVAGTISLDGKPEFSVSNGQGLMYVNIEDKSEISEFDPSSLKIIHTWSISPGESPSGLSFDVKNNRLFAACDNQMIVVVNAMTGEVISTIPIGSGVDASRFDPGTNLLFSSNGEGTLTVIKENSPDNYQVVNNLQTIRGARTMELDKSTHNVFLSAMLNGDRNSNNFGVLVLSNQ